MLCRILIASAAAFTPHISVGLFCSTVFMVHMYGCAVTVFLFNFYCVYVYLTWMNVFAPPVCSAPESQMMVLDGSPRTGVTAICVVPCGCLESNQQGRTTGALNS